MPNRILREGINSSPRVDLLSDGAELLYRRLISVVDDYGRFYASPGTLRGACWPLRPERVNEGRIAEWLKECIAAGLVSIYGQGRFLQMADFRQQVRSKSKFPEPDINCVASAEQLLSTRRSRISESESTIELQQPASQPVPQLAEAQEWPETALAIRRDYPATDDRLVMTVVMESARNYADVVNGTPDIAPFTDQVLADAVRAARAPKQTSAGLYKTSVPRVIRSWAEEVMRERAAS